MGTLVRALVPLRDEPDASVVLGGATGPVKRIVSLLGLEAIFEVVEDVGQVTGVSPGRPRRGGLALGGRDARQDRPWLP